MAFVLIRGEDFKMALEAVGNDTVGATLQSVLKKARDGGPPGDAAPVVLTFDIVHVPEVKTGRGPGWVLSLDSSQTATLKVGEYIADGKVTLADGFVDHTNPILIDVQERVTQ